jgi:hypothetical protein
MMAAIEITESSQTARVVVRTGNVDAVKTNRIRTSKQRIKSIKVGQG